jgi:3-hydroxyacyl-CoA dehydrogenase
MSYEIKKAAVLGAGVMGANIAAHLTNAGIDCVLLDILPSELTEEDKQKGWTEEMPTWRNRLAANGLAQALQAKPAAFYSKKNAARIRTGNFADHLSWLTEVDWIIEAVVENLEIKQDLLARIEGLIKPTCIVSTNTSGLPIRDIVARAGASLKSRFVCTHFFNPPRYMKLLEIIPCAETNPEVLDFMVKFGEDVLGKGAVVCKDVPNFIGNRIGVFDIANAMHLMVSKDMTVEEVDTIVGKELGRPGTALFGTVDLVGLDTAIHVMTHLYEAATNDEMRDLYRPAGFLETMIDQKLLGNKTGRGFYRRSKDKNGEKIKEVLDYKTMAYVPLAKPKFPSLGVAKKIEDPIAKARALFYGEDRAGEFVREYLCNNFIYAANRIPEICDTLTAIDCAMKWGYNHQLGPFEMWDAVGLEESLQVMDNLGKAVPEKIREMMRNGYRSFYDKRADGLYFYDFATKGYIRIEDHPRVILLPLLKERNRVILHNEAASLIDIGEGVACLEFHTKMNSLDDLIIKMIFESCERVEKDYIGMVIGNQGTNFSAGANVYKVLMAIQMGHWDVLESLVAAFQEANMRLKYLSKPVVAAPAGLTLGGGCEICLHTAACQPLGETYIGLVEVGIGVIPAGGGTKELMVRVAGEIYPDVIEAGLNLQQFYAKIFETIAMAKVATSAVEGKELAYLRRSDRISMNRDQQLWDAREVVIGLSRFYRKPEPPAIPVMGENLRGIATAILYNMRHGNYISDYDVHVSRKLVHVLSGGDCAEGTFVTEQEILELEREAFMSLCGESKTQDRMMHILNTGKPLRN